MLARLILTAIAAMIAMPTSLAAQLTRAAPEGHVPPPATIADAAWLIGDWEGSGIDGGEAAESWLRASDGTMVGLFLQEKPNGSVLFTEHMYLSEENGSLILKLKHFAPDLTAWEEKGEMARFGLLSIEPCAAYFVSLTYRCEGDDGLLVAVRMKVTGAAPPEELVFRFKRRTPVAP